MFVRSSRIILLFTLGVHLPADVVANHWFSTDFAFENTNIITSSEHDDFSDYNRLRFESTITSAHLPELFATVIIDNQTRYRSAGNALRDEVVLHRASLNYTGVDHSFVIGRQRIPFGVGRIWNPIDIFNPIIVTSLEPDEREGTYALRYEYGVSELANIDGTLAKDKGALRFKTFLDTADMALAFLHDDEQQRTIVGWELEGELFTSGIEARSEGGIFYERATQQYHSQFIIGAEYGFPNSLNILVEYNHDGQTDADRCGLNCSYQLSPLLSIGLLTLVNLDDQSTCVAPSFSYSLSDEMTLSGGLFLYQGDVHEEFGQGADTLYLNWFIHF